MGSPITLPLWQFYLLIALAFWASLTLFLVPSVRWFLRRRVNRVLERVDQKLHIRLQPFKMTKRRVLIDRLIYDPEVLAAMDAHVREEGLPREVALARVERYAREIVPAFNAYTYFALGYWLSRKVASSLYRLRIGTEDEAKLDEISPSASVVFVMNHRSNMDYVMVSYLAASRTALSYAVGEWARIWPLQQLLRSMGAFFVRRESHNALYRKVLVRYVQMATKSGVTQAVFPEGGLSRDGLMREPKFGLIDYMVRDFDTTDNATGHDVVFIPVGLNYDRTLEDRTLLASIPVEPSESGEPQKALGRMLVLAKTSRFLLRNLGLMMRNKWYRFGYACVNFGAPISLRAWLDEYGAGSPKTLPQEERFEVVAKLVGDLMDSIGRVIPVLPVSLVAEVFLARERPLSLLELQASVFERMTELDQKGAHLYVPREDRSYAIECGLRTLTLRRLVVETEGLFERVPAEEKLLRYYANSIRHL
jgi:glycerol-3-phosphate O-acyltransferase